MSRRNKPYLPLYVQDFLTDEKLAECSASATGVYIRLMCLMHKTEHYGKILLKQKDKQNTKQIENFCFKLIKHFPYPHNIILAGITELLEEGVLQIEGDSLIQRRMVSDSELSETRAKTGSLGGKKGVPKNKNFALAKHKANADIDIDTDTDIDIEIKDENWDSVKTNFFNAYTWKVKFCTDKKITIPDLESKMNEFISDIELKEDYKSLKEIKRHFTNLFNKQNNGSKTFGYSSKPGTSEERIIAARNF